VNGRSHDGALGHMDACHRFSRSGEYRGAQGDGVVFNRLYMQIPTCMESVLNDFQQLE
jgi:hypothetical protein